jgi:hypothetical protein
MSSVEKWDAARWKEVIEAARDWVEVPTRKRAVSSCCASEADDDDMVSDDDEVIVVSD